jgi:hypothetical protein
MIMEVFNEQTLKPTELNLIVDGEELIGEVIDWSKLYYSPITDTWMSDYKTITLLKRICNANPPT